jgi:hypothetical protein
MSMRTSAYTHKRKDKRSEEHKREGKTTCNHLKAADEARISVGGREQTRGTGRQTRIQIVLHSHFVVSFREQNRFADQHHHMSEETESTR